MTPFQGYHKVKDILVQAQVGLDVMEVPSMLSFCLSGQGSRQYVAFSLLQVQDHWR